MEKEQNRERHARSVSAQRYDPKQTNCDAGKRRFISSRSSGVSNVRHSSKDTFNFCFLLPFLWIFHKCLTLYLISDPTSPTKTNSLPGYGRNGLHRVKITHDHIKHLPKNEHRLLLQIGSHDYLGKQKPIRLYVSCQILPTTF